MAKAPPGHQDLRRGPSKLLLAGLQGPGTGQRTPGPSRPPPQHAAKARAEVSSCQASTASGPQPLGHVVSDFPGPGSLKGEAGTSPSSTFDAPGAPSRPDSPLAEGPDPQGHAHVRHPAVSPASRLRCSIPGTNPGSGRTPPAPRASRDCLAPGPRPVPFPTAPPVRAPPSGRSGACRFGANPGSGRLVVQGWSGPRSS